MRCDQARGMLAEHLLGSLPPDEDAALLRHVRGCAACRKELTALGEGLATFAQAAHSAGPPEGLRERVLGVLVEERRESGARRRLVEAATRRSTSNLGRHHRVASTGNVPAWRKATAAVALIAAITWGAVETNRAVMQTHRVNDLQASATSYQRLLDALGGRDVRVAHLEPVGAQQLHGSAILYDSDVGQSWVLVLVRAPGMSGTARVVLSSEDRRIDLRPLQFDQSGDANTSLVTGSSIAGFDRVEVFSRSGELLASGSVSAD